MKEYWVTLEEAQSIIEEHNLIDNAIEFLSKHFPNGGFDEYDVAKMVFDDIDKITKPVADTVWWSEDCNKLMFKLVKEKMKLFISK